MHVPFKPHLPPRLATVEAPRPCRLCLGMMRVGEHAACFDDPEDEGPAYDVAHPKCWALRVSGGLIAGATGESSALLRSELGRWNVGGAERVRRELRATENARIA